MSNFLVLRGFSPLLQRHIEIAARGNTLIAARNLSATNALFEAITGGSAPGAPLPYMLPHDHSPEGGGASIPRGCIYSFDVGDSSSSWTHAMTGTTSWERIGDRAYDFPVFVSPGIDTNNTAISTNPCRLTAKILAATGSADASLKLYNATAQAESSSVTLTTTLAWHTISDVPCTGGRWNEINIQASQGAVGSNNLYIYALSLHETRTNSQPESSGTTTYTSVTRP